MGERSHLGRDVELDEIGQCGLCRERPCMCNHDVTPAPWECQRCGWHRSECRCAFCGQCGTAFTPFRAEEYDAGEFCSVECHRKADHAADLRRDANHLEMQRADSRRRFALAGLPDAAMKEKL